MITWAKALELILLWFVASRTAAAIHITVENRFSSLRTEVKRKFGSEMSKHTEPM